MTSMNPRTIISRMSVVRLLGLDRSRSLNDEWLMAGSTALTASGRVVVVSDLTWPFSNGIGLELGRGVKVGIGVKVATGAGEFSTGIIGATTTV